MRTWQVAALALTVIGAAGAAAVPGDLPDPIAPAAQGKAQCYEPDKAKKTCHAIARYRRDAAGDIMDPAVVLLSAKPMVTFSTTTRVTVSGGRVCGVTTPDDIQAGTFSVDGQPASPDIAGRLLEALWPNEQRLFNKQVCTAYKRAGDGFETRATIDGVPQPEHEHVIWVSPSDGYTVGP